MLAEVVSLLMTFQTIALWLATQQESGGGEP